MSTEAETGGQAIFFVNPMPAEPSVIARKSASIRFAHDDFQNSPDALPPFGQQVDL
jgi:hypothetical protein